MASYYYLMASLPMLRTDAEVPIRYDAFLKMCRGNVPDGVFSVLENLSAAGDESGFLRDWSAFYGKLQAELVYQRSVKLGRSARLPNERSAAVTAAVTAAVRNPDPLAAEQTLLRLSFAQLDELVGFHNFDERALYGYAVKLQLLERQRTFDHETGKEEFAYLLDDLRQQVFSM